MLAIFNFFQTIGFYGFANWVPQLLASQGASFSKSLQYGFIIALVYPLGPFICSLFADKLELKWQIVSAALGTATFGLIFARMSGGHTRSLPWRCSFCWADIFPKIDIPVVSVVWQYTGVGEQRSRKPV